MLTKASAIDRVVLQGESDATRIAEDLHDICGDVRTDGE